MQSWFSQSWSCWSWVCSPPTLPWLLNLLPPPYRAHRPLPPAVAYQPSGVEKAQLSATNFGEVTTYALPKPLKAPNSIASASDGSVWFGEIGLRGVAHLFLNGTLLEYAWPASDFSPSENCLDINALWGLAIWHGLVWATDYSNDQIVGLVPSNDTFHTIALAPGDAPAVPRHRPGGEPLVHFVIDDRHGDRGARLADCNAALLRCPRRRRADFRVHSHLQLQPRLRGDRQPVERRG